MFGIYKPFVTSIAPDDVNNRDVYEDSLVPTRKNNFYAGSKYWVEKDGISSKRTCVSWYNGSIFMGGKSCAILGGSSIACCSYNRNSNSIIVIWNTGSNLQIRIYKIEEESTETTFSVSLYSSRTFRSFSGAQATVYGFKTDAKTLYIKFDIGNNTTQTLTEYIFSSDYSTQTSVDVFTGGTPITTWNSYYSNTNNAVWIDNDSSNTINVGDGVFIVSEHRENNIAITLSGESTLLIDVIINEDNVDVILYTRISEQIPLSEFIYDYYFTGIPGTYPYPNSFTSSNSLEYIKSFKYDIKRIVDSALVTVAHPDFSGSLNSTYYVNIDRTASTANPADISYDVSLNHLYSGNYKIPLYVNSSKDIYVYQEIDYSFNKQQTRAINGVVSDITTDLIDTEIFNNKLKIESGVVTGEIKSLTDSDFYYSFDINALGFLDPFNTSSIPVSNSYRVYPTTVTSSDSGWVGDPYPPEYVWDGIPNVVRTTENNTKAADVKDQGVRLTVIQFDPVSILVTPSFFNSNIVFDYAYDSRNLLFISSLPYPNFGESVVKSSLILTEIEYSILNIRLDEDAGGSFLKPISVTHMKPSPI